MKKTFSILLFLILSLAGINGKVQAQEFVTLFPYPTAPDTCRTLESRCDYSTAHFWDKFEYSRQLTSADDSLLAKAMSDYFDIMAHADLKVATTSVRNLMFKAQTNQKNFVRLLDVAYRMLFTGLKPLTDDVFLAFAQSAVDATWLPAKSRDGFKEIMRRIANTRAGQPISDFAYSGTSGRGRFNDGIQEGDSALVLLFFTRDDADSPLEATRLSADLGVSSLISRGYLKLVEVYGGKNDDYVATETKANPTWQVVSSKDAHDNLDLRFVPSLMLLDAKHRIIYKNMVVDDIKNLIQ